MSALLSVNDLIRALTALRDEGTIGGYMTVVFSTDPEGNGFHGIQTVDYGFADIGTSTTATGRSSTGGEFRDDRDEANAVVLFPHIPVDLG